MTYELRVYLCEGRVNQEDCSWVLWKEMRSKSFHIGKAGNEDDLSTAYSSYLWLTDLFFCIVYLNKRCRFDIHILCCTSRFSCVINLPDCLATRTMLNMLLIGGWQAHRQRFVLVLFNNSLHEISHRLESIQVCPSAFILLFTILFQISNHHKNLKSYSWWIPSTTI